MAEGEQIGGLVRVEGMKELAAKLDDLESKVVRKVTSQALRAGAKVTLAAAMSTMPVKSGALRGSLKVRAGRYKKGFVSISVGIGKQWFTGDQFYGAFVEFGHRLGRRKLGDKRHKIPGEHPILYAYEE